MIRWRFSAWVENFQLLATGLILNFSRNNFSLLVWTSSLIFICPFGRSYIALFQLYLYKMKNSWVRKYSKSTLFFYMHVCEPQGQSHYNGRCAIEFKCNWVLIPGTETLALLKSSWMEWDIVTAPNCSHRWFWTRHSWFCRMMF